MLMSTSFAGWTSIHSGARDLEIKAEDARLHTGSALRARRVMTCGRKEPPNDFMARTCVGPVDRSVGIGHWPRCLRRRLRRDGTVRRRRERSSASASLSVRSRCRAAQFDRNGDGTIGIDELVASVDSNVNTCEPSAGGLRLEPVGGEFRLNTAATGSRGRAQVAMDDEGGLHRHLGRYHDRRGQLRHSPAATF